jgi:hypothetical protein
MSIPGIWPNEAEASTSVQAKERMRRYMRTRFLNVLSLVRRG